MPKREIKKIQKDYGGRIVHIEIENASYTAVKIGPGKKNFALTRFTDAKSEHGFILSLGSGNENVKKWEIIGTVEIDEAVFFYGPFFSGAPLYAIAPETIENNLPFFFRSLAAICRHDVPQHIPLFGNGVIFKIEDDSILILPPKLMELLAGELDTEEQRQVGFHFSVYTPPQLSEEEGCLRFAACWIYYCITRTIPDNTGFSNIVPPHLLRTKLKRDISHIVMQAIQQPDTVSTDHFFQMLLDGKIDDPTITLAEEKKREAELRLLKETKRLNEKRRHFLKKNGIKIGLLIIFSVTALAVSGKIIYNRTRPPVTVGMEPEEVIQRFYEHYSALNPEAMEDLVYRNSKLDEISETINLTVLTKIRTAYEGNNPIVSAEEWEAAGKPDLPPGKLLFGITDVAITERTRNNFIVDYKKYSPSEVFTISEEIIIEYVKGGPLIKEIRLLNR